MKSILKNIGAVLALTIILFAGCKNPAEDVQIVVNTDIFKSPTLIHFVNAKKGTEGPQNFDVKIIGQNADLVRTTTGGKTFKAAAGMLNLVLDRSANPSTANPVKFTVVASSIPGFAPIFQDVVITSDTIPSYYKIEVKEYANPSNGYAAIIDTKPLSSGTASSDITITTPTNAGLVQQTSITIPSGTSFTDASGSTINGSQLEARVLFNGTATNKISPMATGGNVVKNIVGFDNKLITRNFLFIPAGMLNIDMFIGGKEVKTFSKPVIVDMEVNPNRINPATNAAIKAGETIPMWSLNDETGQWKVEGNATLIVNGSGKLVARMPISHLSGTMAADLIDLDLNVILKTPLEISQTGITFLNLPTPISCSATLVINKTASLKRETFEVEIPGGVYNGSVAFEPGETTKTISLSHFNDNYSVALVTATSFGSSSNYKINSQSTNPLTCGSTSTLTFEALPDRIEVDVDVKVKCSGNDLLTGINAGITISPINDPDNTSIHFLNNGKGNGFITNGTTYKIVASVDGKAYTSQFTATRDNFKLPDGFDLVGTAIFNGDRLYINGTVTKTDCK